MLSQKLGLSLLLSVLLQINLRVMILVWLVVAIVVLAQGRALLVDATISAMVTTHTVMNVDAMIAEVMDVTDRLRLVVVETTFPLVEVVVVAAVEVMVNPRPLLSSLHSSV